MALLCPGDQSCYVAALRLLCAAALVVAVQSTCGPLPRLTYAAPREDYSNRTSFPWGTTVEYTCRPGYTKRSASFLHCDRLSRWTVPFYPFCVPRQCPHPVAPDNGQVVILTDLRFGSTINFTCEDGYRLIGSSQSSCVIAQGAVEWDQGVPLCQLIPCLPPPTINHGTHNALILEEFSYGTSVTYKCDSVKAGEIPFSLVGEASIYCTSRDKHNGVWSGPPPECKAIHCKTPHLDNGRIVNRYSSVHTWNSILLLECNKGFTLRGNSNIQCNENNTWSPPVPVCERSGCDDPPNTDRIMQRDFFFSSEELSAEFPAGSVFTYTCWSGYEFRPGENKLTITCQSNFQWSKRPSPCGRISCPAPSVHNGEVVRSFQLQWLYIARNEGRKYFYGDTISIQCNRGYGLHGDKEIRCNENGDWSPAIPQCVREPVCPSPHIEHGTLVPSHGMEHTPGSTVEVGCNAGYVLSGPRFIKCQSDETWKPPEPFCDKACGPPPDIKQGQHSGGTKEHFFYGSEVKYSCAEGLSLIGESSIYCTLDDESNMTWSGPAPRCEKVRCRRPVIKNGRMTTTKYVFLYGTTVQFSCSEGYMMDGSRESQCQEDSNWSPPLPSCHLVRCPKPDLPHGRVMGNQDEKAWYHMNETITFSCPEGHRFLGCWHLFRTDMWTITCRADGKWTDFPKCVKEDEVYKTAYDVKEFCQCDICLLQVRILKEIENLKLEIKNQTCDPHPATHSFFGSSSQDGSVQSRTLSLASALPGSTLAVSPALQPWLSPSTMKASLCGSWQLLGTFVLALLPTGALESCKEPPNIPHAFQKNYVGQLIPPGTVVMYGCNRGYEFISGITQGRVTCLQNLTWSDVPNFCQRVQCPPPQIANGTYTPLPKTGEEKYAYEDAVTIECNAGYGVNGSTQIRCRHDGSWDPRVPHCVPGCGSPPRVENGQHSHPGRGYFSTGSSVTYRCLKGYTLQGEASIRCETGDDETAAWSGPLPQCEAVQCPAPSIQNGRLKPPLSQNYSYKSNISFECDPGYVIRGSEIIWCQADTKWSPRPPVCNLGSCSYPPALDSANQVPRKDFPVGSVVTYSCRPGYTLIPGVIPRITCLNNFTWSKVPEFCERLYCPNPAIENGALISVSRKEHVFGNRVEFHCHFGYVLRGSSSVHCGGDGMWHPPLPFCDKVCGPPPSITKGKHSGTGQGHYPYGSKVTYSCAEGLSLIGESSIYCTSGNGVNLTWSGPAPRCKFVRCPMPVVHNGRTISDITAFLYGATVQFSCNKGYRIDGNGESWCQEDSTWSSPEPTCQPVQCPKPKVENGRMVNPTSEKPWYKVNETVSFKCSPGYQFSGHWYLPVTETWKITCSADGNWTTFPTCTKQGSSAMCDVVVESRRALQCGVPLVQLKSLLEVQKLYLEIEKLKREIKKLG
ncbi:PREDICTED: complement receptor type 2-like [Crocodylus porosus]|uniref:complement receptor type 2-like n=1 Tax=Crocodylus porosus TaxID=8502 RepID=UPI00093B7D47|nr:PREDICTED: complement receptor type 2-like [Crocodylus porosus]